MLRIRDQFGVAVRHGLLMLGLMQAGRAESPEQLLAAAMHREMVIGDLKGAIEQYRAVAAVAGVDRGVAAAALLHLGQCLEKTGQRKEARVVYTRLAGEYRDQAAANEARVKLAGWTDAAPGPRNLTFEEGEEGKTPPGWFTPSVGQGVAELRRKGCRSQKGCAVVTAQGKARLGNLMQSFSAAAYRGKTVRLRAWLRLQATAPDDRAQLWLRVDRSNGQDGFNDNMDDRPERSATWTLAEVATEVDADAQFLGFGVSSAGGGRAWVDDVNFEIVPRAEVDTARDAVRDLYRGADAAVAGFESQLTSFRLTGAGAVATVRGELKPGPAALRLHGTCLFRDSWTRAGGWRLKQRRYISGRITAPLTNADTARLVAADLKRLASPLAAAEAGHTFYDLAPFGNAVGEARLVALGEAARGTREPAQLRHRILEYLVREKGYSVLAASIDDGAAETKEMRDLLEWVRSRQLTFAALPQCRPDPIELDVTANRLECDDEGAVAEIERILAAHPGEKVLVWTDNARLRLNGRSPTLGSRLREKLGAQFFAAGFALRGGQLRSAALKNGNLVPPAIRTIPKFAEGTGDGVFSSAGMPLFFLDLRLVPPMTTLGFWLAEPHLFLNVRGIWNSDEPENALEPVFLGKAFDGVIFVESAHAAQTLADGK